MKLPKKYDEQPQETTQGINTFIGAGDKRPTGRKKVKGTLFTLTEDEISYIDETSKTTGATKVNVVRAGLKALEMLDPNERLRLLGEISLKSPGRWNG